MKSFNFTTFATLALTFVISLLLNNKLQAQISNQTLTPADASVCPGDSTTISTASSDAGVKYYLRDNADSSIVEGPVVGNGSALTFNTGPLTSATSYHVYAEQTSSAMDFDGVDDIVNTTNLVPWDNSSTLMCWYKSADFSSGALFVWGSPIVNNYAVLEFRYVNPSFNYIRFYQPQTTFPSVLPHPNNPNDWHHVAIVQDGAATRLYLDGQLASTGFVPSPTNPTQTSLGAGLFNNLIQLHSDGLIDEMSHWDTVLSPAQINQYMNQPLAGNEPNLDLYYSFESVSGNTLPDESTGSNDGIMMNMSANPLVPGVFPGDSAFMNQIITIGVDTLPVVSGGPNQTVCEGDSITLNGAGAATYVWDNNVSDGVPFASTSSTTYNVIGTDGNGCVGTSHVMVTVNTLPTVDAGTDQLICSGDSVTLSGSGANSYTWDNSVMDGVAFTPSATATYTVIGTDSNNCKDSDQMTVTLRAAPIVSAGQDLDVCDGDSVTLMGSGASTYTWNNNVQDGVTFLPSASSDYIVTGTDTAGCSASDTVSVSIITVDATVSVSGITLTANATNATYQWLDCDNGFASIAGETNAAFTPTANGNYAVAVTEMGCTDTSACENVIVVGMDAAAQIDFDVFPNPSNGQIRVTVHGLETLEAELQVIDLQGKVIHRSEMQGASTKALDLRDAAAGIYFVRIQGKHTHRFKRIVLR
ncbi:MAG: LamG-like jellyroll fold domain-containing protein [Bacteroidota bacterium]